MTRFCLILLGVLILAPAHAAPEPADAPAKSAAPDLHAPVPDSVTHHSLTLPGRTLDFTATAGFIRVTDAEGAPAADLNLTAYVLDKPGTPSRPVTFVLNGGPGMASAWLQMGALGPWRIDMVPGPSAPSDPLPNDETWLDFTDLVFIDPAGTGYSRLAPGNDRARKQLFSVDGDIDSIAQAIKRWLVRARRTTAPLYVAGESYGGFRAPLLARRLAEHEGIGLDGLVLISPVLDFGNHSRALDVLGLASLLPSLAAADRATKGFSVSRDDLAAVEDYAESEFITDVLRGAADTAAVERVVQRVAALTGLDPSVVRRHRGLVTGQVYAGEHDPGRIDSLYDATVSLAAPRPEAEGFHPADPLLDGLRAPLTEAVLAVYDRLNWHPDGPPYHLLSEAANHAWDFGEDMRPESFNALRQALALDPRLHVVVAEGLFDLVAPYRATQILLNQIPAQAGGDRIRVLTLPAGHMVYSRIETRRALRAAAADTIAAGSR